MSSSSDSKSVEYKTTHKSPNGKFIPSNDIWEFEKIEKNNEGKYKITVENIKGRKFLNAFMWEPDYYYTDWF